ncbi:MAG TPA: hypothetical protein VKP67_08400 [Xanthobacteraceae bacterium]|nr:hypothetical protein [Xanthobacteraceae bacterium]
MRHRSDRPDAGAVLFLELDFDKGGRQLMMILCKLHRLAVVHAAEDGEALV